MDLYKNLRIYMVEILRFCSLDLYGFEVFSMDFYGFRFISMEHLHGFTLFFHMLF